MDYPIKYEGDGLLIVSDRGFDIWIRPPYVDIVNFDIYVGELKGNDQLLHLALEKIKKLAERLGVGEITNQGCGRNVHISIDLSIGEVDGRQMQQELAQLFDSEELVEAVVRTS